MARLWIAAKTLAVFAAMTGVWIVGLAIVGYLILMAFSYIPLVGRRGKPR